MTVLPKTSVQVVPTRGFIKGVFFLGQVLRPVNPASHMEGPDGGNTPALTAGHHCQHHVASLEYTFLSAYSGSSISITSGVSRLCLPWPTGADGWGEVEGQQGAALVDPIAS